MQVNCNNIILSQHHYNKSGLLLQGGIMSAPFQECANVTVHSYILVGAFLSRMKICLQECRSGAPVNEHRVLRTRQSSIKYVLSGELTHLYTCPRLSLRSSRRPHALCSKGDISCRRSHNGAGCLRWKADRYPSAMQGALSGNHRFPG